MQRHRVLSGLAWIFRTPRSASGADRGSIEPQHVRTSGRSRLSRLHPAYRTPGGSQSRAPEMWGLALVCLALVLVFPASVPRAGAHADLIPQIEDVTRQIEKDPRNIDLYVRRGELYRTHAEWNAALADFDTILVIEPTNRWVNLAKGRLMADASWLLTAKGYLDRFIAEQPSHAEALSSRARLLTRLKLHLAAADDYDAAIRLSPEAIPELFIERAQTLASNGPDFVGRAIEGLDEGIKRLGPLVTLQLSVVDLELKRKNYDAALERIAVIAQRSPRKETWLARRGEILEQAGRPDEARTAYQNALAALASLPHVRRNVPAMAQLEKRIRTQLDAINGAQKPK
ncbi:MAG TPA: tetratricopeptide repeat protein [Verrucomicrobiae bacterium]|nr:tetratricopeptide repeat protein [Verrucomicrobiae bacterium]